MKLFSLYTIGLITLFFFQAACDKPTRYKIATTVFTGVPPYEEFEMESPEQDTQEKEKKDQTGKLEFFHPLYEAGKCDKCHKNAAPYLSPGDETVNTSTELLRPIDKLCVSCHTQLTPRNAIRNNLWMHNPVARSRCMDCHEPHQSKNMSVLKQPESELCLSCHDTQLLENENHPDINDTCGSCHNSHIGINKFLLSREHAENLEIINIP